MSSPAGPFGPPPPVRIVHLGLGNFFRAHQAWYTAHASDAADWGFAAFTGHSPRSSTLAAALASQQGRYTLIVRSPAADEVEIVTSISRAYPGSELTPLLEHLADPAVAVVTLTVTEAGYVSDGRGLNRADAAVLADLRAWSSHPAHLRTMPARLVAGLAARRASGAGPIAVVSCDNLPDNGGVTRAVVTDFARALDPELADWIAGTVSFVTTVVDRITPATTDTDLARAAELTGCRDRVPVVTEPFHEWVLAGGFPAGRPAWQDAGARFVDDVTAYEQRKLWLLNGGHSLLAYLGSARGHLTVAEAVADQRCLDWLSEWWELAGAHLDLPPAEIAAYRSDLLDRFGNPRIRHLLAQIAADGSRKLPIRVVPVLLRERAAGRIPVPAVRILAGWINHLRGAGAPVRDPDAAQLIALAGESRSTTAILGILDPVLAHDDELAAAVDRTVAELTGGR